MLGPLWRFRQQFKRPNTCWALSGGSGQQFKRRNTCWAFWVFSGGFGQQCKRRNTSWPFCGGFLGSILRGKQKHLNPLKPMTRATCLPQPPGFFTQPSRFFKPGKFAWKHLNHLQNKTKHLHKGFRQLSMRHFKRQTKTFESTSDASNVFAPTPGLFTQPSRFFKPSKFAWKHMNHLQNKTKP